MEILIPEKIRCVLQRLEARGHEAFIVGGCVRDSLMGAVPKDYDVTTSASPEEIKSAFADMKTIDTGIKHGTVTVVSGGENVEVTTYRVDGHYSDNRRPDNVFFTKNLDEDLSRRDFTVNAMAYSDKTGLVDRWNGRRDLENKLIRCVGDAGARFDEDALRILRALRFASRFGFSIENSTEAAIFEKSALIKNVSAERILSELRQIVCGKYPADILIKYAPVLEEFIPEITPCVGFDTHSDSHIYDVWEHTARAVEYSENDMFVRLALLLHDIEKPPSLSVNENGKSKYPQHAEKSAVTAGKILRRLRSDNKTAETVCLLIKYHSIKPTCDKREIKKLLSVIGEENFLRLIGVKKGDTLAKAPSRHGDTAALDKMKETARRITEAGECFSKDSLAVNGRDALEKGFVGKDIGAVLDRLLALVIEEKLPNSRGILLEEMDRIKSESLSDG